MWGYGRPQRGGGFVEDKVLERSFSDSDLQDRSEKKDMNNNNNDGVRYWEAHAMNKVPVRFRCFSKDTNLDYFVSCDHFGDVYLNPELVHEEHDKASGCHRRGIFMQFPQ